MSNADEPAFPTEDVTTSNGDVQYGATGLTKLEYFAGLAMAALITANHPDYEFNHPIVARDAVSQAQALIAELDKQP